MHDGVQEVLLGYYKELLGPSNTMLQGVVMQALRAGMMIDTC